MSSDSDIDSDFFSDDAETVKKIPYELLKKIQADSSATKIPQIRQQRPTQNDRTKQAILNAIESAKTTKKKRSNKLAPTLVSSDKPYTPEPPHAAQNSILPSQPKARDPRFSDLSGKLDTVGFAQAYGFLDDMRKNELNMLQEKIKDNKLGEKKKEVIKKEIMRRKTQENQRKRLTDEITTKRRLRREEKEKIEKFGKKPFFFSDKKVKKEMFAGKYSEMVAKNANIDGVMAKRRKKLARRDRNALAPRRSATLPDDN